MSKSDVNYTVEDLFELRFSQSFRGYKLEEVDGFIDTIAKDYIAFNNEIDRLKDEINQLKKGYGYR